VPCNSVKSLNFLGGSTGDTTRNCCQSLLFGSKFGSGFGVRFFERFFGIKFLASAGSDQSSSCNKLAAVASNPCNEGARLQFLLHGDGTVELLTEHAQWPCEHETDWHAEWQAGRKHYLFLCGCHAAEEGLIW
jgi:hypothetical protein